MNTSQYMDKQIMDLSKAQPNNNTDFINLNNPNDEGDEGNKDEIVPSYDFQPIRPVQSPPQQSQSLDNGDDGGSGARVWNSADSVTVRNYASLDSIEPAKGVPEKYELASNATLVSEIDCIMKKYADNLMHALDGVSARISQLESRSRNLENSMDDLKVTVGNNQGSTDGKLGQLENILREVQSGVHVIRDKQDIIEGQLHLAKLQASKVEPHPEPQSHIQTDSFQQIASVTPQSHHQQPPPPPPISLPPPPPGPQHHPNQYPPTQNLPPQPRDSYYPPPSQPQGTAQQYPTQPSLSAPPPQLPQYPPAPPQYSQPAPPQQHPSLSSMNPPQPQQHPSLSSMNPPQPQLPMSHHPKDSPYPPQSYPSSQQFYNSPSHTYDTPSSRPGSGYSPTYGPSSAPNEPPPYPHGGPSSQYGGGRDYPQLPTARVLPQALPTASAVGGGESGGGSGGGNRVPIDDVVDKVTHMGFPRDQVRATVRKLTENGQSVDLNIVLDKLMNDGVEAQPQRGGWFGR